MFNVKTENLILFDLVISYLDEIFCIERDSWANKYAIKMIRPFRTAHMIDII